ncbi:GNAT family N-acetyltransferase [Marixanthomonas spongiae]|uniref:GNAT family N-acetyltransferase n=1 Tax=Marixanthomonas spongiae TaxID=2174845 RepID=A0A2U0I5U3_9FLAO|nr:GNAT family N-acetyltransferase [Marixanthomonas spongiae]PVW16475.1 GNAT family N-acetyltransferase [Marixanthomonas spongiae]
MSYTFKKTSTTPDALARYSRLLSGVFTTTDKFTPAYLRWQYEENPMGNVVGYDAFYEGNLAGHYVTIPVRYTINGTPLKGLLSLNTATHKDHRGKGLFTKLATKTYEEATALGYDFVIGVANQNSTPGFIKKLGFYLVAPLDVKFGVGHIRYDKETTYTVQPLWTQAALQWRLANPHAAYAFNGKNMYCKTDKPFVNVLLYHDYKAADRPIQKSLSIKLWIGLANNLKTTGAFIAMPKRLKPSPLNLIFKNLNANIPKIEKQDMLFESVDFDAY